MLKHGDATPEDHRKLQYRLCPDRNVPVQTSRYGRDHRVLLAGLRALGPSARGAAVVDPPAMWDRYPAMDLRRYRGI